MSNGFIPYSVDFACRGKADSRTRRYRGPPAVQRVVSTFHRLENKVLVRSSQLEISPLSRLNILEILFYLFI